MRHFLLLSLAAVVLSACTSSPTGRSQFMLISPQAAIARSEPAYISTVQNFESQGKLLRDPALAARIANITGRLVSQAAYYYPHTAGWQWSVALVDEPDTINAWCMAGGRMAIFSGIINKLDLSDDEIAHIMGHEISHAVANHTAERMSIAIAQQLGVVAVQVSSEDRATTELASMAANLAVSLPNSRGAELEADELGMRLAVLAGYEPDAAVTLWQKMDKEGGSRPPEFLSTHPSPSNRADRLSRLAGEARALAPSVAPEPFDVRMYP